MSGDVTTIKIRNTQIKENIENNGKTKQRRKSSILLNANRILDGKINSENPDWLNQ